MSRPCTRTQSLAALLWYFFPPEKVHTALEKGLYTKKQQKSRPQRSGFLQSKHCYLASDTATATATVAPTIGLLPIPIKPIISTCAGTEEEPANCASLCIRPIVSVIP